MAKEVSRTADMTLGALIVQIDDGHGNVLPFTCYVMSVDDPEAAIAAEITAVGARADALHARMSSLLK